MLSLICEKAWYIALFVILISQAVVAGPKIKFVSFVFLVVVYNNLHFCLAVKKNGTKVR